MSNKNYEKLIYKKKKPKKNPLKFSNFNGQGHPNPAKSREFKLLESHVL